MTTDGAVAVETLRVEFARAKEQASKSDAATLNAIEELRAEQAAHCQSKEKIAKMDVELKDAAGPEGGHGSGQGNPLANQSGEGGTPSSRRYCGWEALFVADEV